jgi:hypothetical protein
MPLDKAALISVAVAIAAAGMMWFVWELLQNLRAAMRRRAEKRNLVAHAAAIGRRAVTEDNGAPPA